MNKISFILFLLLFSVTVFAEDEIDSFVQSEMQKEKIPGLALLMVKDGRIVKEKGYGYASLEHMVPVTPQTVFQSGSMGKQFTATAVMLLVEDGRIQLDDPVSKYIEGAPDTWKNIKTRNLLTHTSGLDDYPDDFNYRQDQTEDQLLGMLKKQPLNFQPGQKWEYSNLGYMLLGIIIHKASGQFYGDFLQQRVFQPLGMTTTRIINEADIIPNRAAGYHLVNGQVKNQDWVAPSLNTTADGALYFTILDLAKWDAALYTEKILKKSSLDQMWTPVRLNDGSTYPYGFGWYVSEIRGHRVIEHSGTWQGFRGFIARYVNDHFTVVVLMNQVDAERVYIAHTIAGLYDPALKPTKTEAEEEKE